MAINYSETITGTMKVEQNFGNEKVTYKFEFRESNCLACIIHVSKNPESISEKDKYIHRLKCFFADTEHLKRCAKMEGGLKSFFGGKIKNISLNIYYKENEILARYFAKAGINTEIYYKEPKLKR